MIAYDFPHRLRTPGAARRELHNLKRSLETATQRHEQNTVAYLKARQQRARTATRRLHGHLTEDSE